MLHGGETGVTFGSFLPSFGEEKEAIPAVPHTLRAIKLFWPTAVVTAVISCAR